MKSNRLLAAGGLLAVAVIALAGPARAQLPPVPVPAENPTTPDKVTLGKMLFWEEQMSSDNSVACGTCHRPQAGGGDARVAPNPGADLLPMSPDDVFASPGVVSADAAHDFVPDPVFRLRRQVTSRNSPNIFGAPWATELFWDGRAGTAFLDPDSGELLIGSGGALESQAVVPLVSEVEMAHMGRTMGDVAGRLQSAVPMRLATGLTPDIQAMLAANSTYPDLFAAVFGDASITTERIAFAIAAYERTLGATQTPWDAFMAGNPTAMTPSQIAGWNLFQGAARCNLCHTPGLFTDNGFHNLGLRPVAQDVGRQAVTGSFADRGKFKTPTLRSTGLRTRWMHTGQFQNLNQVVNFYAGGGGGPDNRDPLLIPLNLSPLQRNQLVDFVANGLRDQRTALGTGPFARPTLRSELPPNPRIFGLGTGGGGGPGPGPGPGPMPAGPQAVAPSPPNLGNPVWKIGVDGGFGGAPAVLGVSLNPAIPGTSIGGIPINIALDASLVTIPYALEGAGLGPGQGWATFRLGLPDLPVLAGTQVYFQWLIAEPVGLTASQGIEAILF